MQTFLPYSDFKKTAQCLDYRRLGKQRVEAMQILNIVSGKTPHSRWKNHPCVKMWIGYENCLGKYMNEMIHEWISRGYKNTMKFWKLDEASQKPRFIENPAFHASHRASLLAKDYNYYKQFGWIEKPEINYIWEV